MREQMARRAAQELRDGYYVNLGIGIPTLVANFIPEGMNVTLQSENGLLGHRAVSRPRRRRSRPDQCGQADDHDDSRLGFFSSADSFAMIRGGHIDLSILGALEVAETAISRTGWCPARW